MQRSTVAGRRVECANEFFRSREVAFVRQPHLRIGFAHRQLPYPALRVLVEHVSLDAGLLKEPAQYVRVGQAGGFAETFHRFIPYRVARNGRLDRAGASS